MHTPMKLQGLADRCISTHTTADAHAETITYEPSKGCYAGHAARKGWGFEAVTH